MFKRVSSLSGGEKARVSLAKLMLQNANMLILDEPTNHLDLFSKEVLEAALMDYEGTLLFISHDRYFLNKMADRVLELDKDGITAYLGNYDDYIEKKLELEEARAEAADASSKTASRTESGSGATGAGSIRNPASANGSTKGVAAAPAASSYEADKQAKREERSRQRRLEQLEQEISQLEQDIAGLEEQLTLPEVYNDYIAVQGINSELDTKRQQLQEHYETWEQLMA
ncbi:putative ABC transporter ATP-binding protein [compost metagenome]